MHRSAVFLHEVQQTGQAHTVLIALGNVDLIGAAVVTAAAYGYTLLLATLVGLRKLNPDQFEFAVLERVSSDMAPDDVIRVEASWRDRLGTREHGLNKN